MHQKYLGDSFDLVKRFWADSLRPIGKLHAHPRFIPQPIRAAYTLMTGMLILDETSPPEAPFGLLFDPNTGIREAGEATGASQSHVSLQFLIRQIQQSRPAYIICFDQSHHRRHELNRKGQRDAKRRFLSSQGFASLYYDSHAPFLFVTQTPEALNQVRERLQACGLPAERLEVDVAAA